MRQRLRHSFVRRTRLSYDKLRDAPPHLFGYLSHQGLVVEPPAEQCPPFENVLQRRVSFRDRAVLSTLRRIAG